MFLLQTLSTIYPTYAAAFWSSWKHPQSSKQTKGFVSKGKLEFPVEVFSLTALKLTDLEQHFFSHCLMMRKSKDSTNTQIWVACLLQTFNDSDACKNALPYDQVCGYLTQTGCPQTNHIIQIWQTSKSPYSDQQSSDLQVWILLAWDLSDHQTDGKNLKWYM